MCCQDLPGSGQDSVLVMQEARVCTLVGELRSNMPATYVSKKKKRNMCCHGTYVLC